MRLISYYFTLGYTDGVPLGSQLFVQLVLVDGDDNTGTDGTAALTDSETQTLLDSDGGDQLNAHLDVIAGHAHLGALGQSDDAGNVGGAEVELGTIVVEEGV